ncbi:MAG: sulfatase [Firmicutes bacterium]|nr:sulfatase [Bacillota bacterium]MCM1400474.1 sulfatase [Bacteroides sp.]MCM1477445.1 sulfatase [Bacteroides sp.]
MVDDMGWQDTSVPFADSVTAYNRMFHTPNMERLARQGVKFTQAYACSISSPSRCSLITGANNARHRVTNWTLQRDRSTDLQHEGITLPQWNINGVQQVEGIPHSYVGRSFVDILRQNGYHTIHVGKAHFGAKDTPGEAPEHWGFEKNIAGHAAGGLATYLSELNYGHDDNGNPTSLMSIPGLEKYWGTGTFATEALTQEALKALDKAALYNQPYFLYMAHYAVHIPIDKDPRYYDKYIAEGLSPKEAAYASLVEGMDKSLGDIMDWVERNGRADNTIIIFMSDNGGLASAPEWRDGPIYTQNAPLRSGKGSLLEGGIREPLIVKWPGVTAQNSSNSNYVMIEDFYPTILEMARAEWQPEASRPVDGVSFVPLLRDSTATTPAERELVWNFPNVWGNEGPGINLCAAIRRGPWKLIYHYDTGEKELYNIPADISELHNLASSEPETVKFLSHRLGELLRERGADRPSFTATGRPCPWPDEI